MSQDKNFLVIRASAGSGKTFRLVQEYLQCCLTTNQADYFKHILAITFTRNAAMEMRERILSSINEIALGEGPMFHKIQTNLGLDGEVLKSRADRVRRAMLHQYEDFSVMTIDSFVSRLVRGFARELALEENFQIEQSLDVMVDGAVTRLLDKVGLKGHEDITTMLEEFTRRLIREEKDIRLRKQLTDFGKLLGDERALTHLKPLDREDETGNRIFTPEYFIGLHEVLQAKNKKRLSDLKLLAKAALEEIAKSGLEHADFSGGYLPKWLVKLAKDGKGFKHTPSATLSKQLASLDFTRGNTPDQVAAAMQAIHPFIEAVHSFFEREFQGELGRLNLLLEQLEDKVFHIGALVELRFELRSLEVEENIRISQSLNAHISEIVQTNSTPFIYERLGVKYKHLFVDEFQDTSITQWHNLVPLVADLLASKNRCLVVGDTKQAIYRWRNGDYRQLEQLPRLIGESNSVEMQEHERKLMDEHDPAPLNTNRRSDRYIVAWNNTLFEHIKPKLKTDLAPVYAKCRQFAFTENDGAVTVDSVVLKNKGEFEAASIQWALRKLVTHIGGWLEEEAVSEGEIRYTHHQEGGLPRKFDPGDCAILVRTNAQGAELARALLAANIKTFTDDSLQLGRHPVPLGVVALLRSVLEPDHFGHGVTFLQCYCAISGKDESTLLKAHRKEQPYTRRDGSTGVVVHFDLEGMLQSECSDLKLAEWTAEPLVGLMGHIISVLNWDRGNQAYVEGLLEQAQKAKNAHESGIPGFLKAWDLRGHKQSIRSAEQPDAVRIKTIHKAKGQAFPVVLMPIQPSTDPVPSGHLPVELNEEICGLPVALFTANDLKNTSLQSVREDEMHKALLDELNVLYVGMTRPKRQLDLFFGLMNPPAKPTERPPGEPGTITALLLEAVQDAFGKSLMEAEPWVYEPAEGAVKMDPEFGTQEASSKPPARTAEVRVLDDLKLGMPVKPMVVEPPKDWWNGGGLSARKRGEALHSLLSQLRSIDDYPTLVEQLRSSMSWSVEDRQWMEEMLERILSSPQLAPLFQSGLEVELERTFWTGKGQLGRPDRLVNTPEGWVVLDYKTGKPSKKDLDQVRGYMEAVSGVGTEAVRGLIYYTATDELIAVGT